MKLFAKDRESGNVSIASNKQGERKGDGKRNLKELVIPPFTVYNSSCLPRSPLWKISCRNSIAALPFCSVWKTRHLFATPVVQHFFCWLVLRQMLSTVFLPWRMSGVNFPCSDCCQISLFSENFCLKLAQRNYLTNHRNKET